jgi:nucleoside-triphosphatase
MIKGIRKNVLITGFPQVGKTTLIKKLSEELSDLHPVGFYTEEIREEGIRKGFELISLDEKRGLLSHIGINSPYRVGKYKVDVKGFEEFLEGIPFLNPETSLIIIDEIGKMECFSHKFRRVINDIINSEKVFIATIALKGGGFIEEIKGRDDIKFFEMTKNNRGSLLSEILSYGIRILDSLHADSNPGTLM